MYFECSYVAKATTLKAKALGPKVKAFMCVARAEI